MISLGYYLNLMCLKSGLIYKAMGTYSREWASIFLNNLTNRIPTRLLPRLICCAKSRGMVSTLAPGEDGSSHQRARLYRVLTIVPR